MRWLGAAFCLFWIQSAHSLESPLIRVEVSADVVNVGQTVQVSVIVLVPTWFNKPTVYPSLELANSIVRQPANGSYPTSERINGETWSGVVRNYEIVPQLAARYVFADKSARVNYANPGSTPLVVDIGLPAIEFTAVVPVGAEALDPFIAGTELTLVRSFDPSLEPSAEELDERFEAGDALTVTVNAQMKGSMPALFLPPLVRLVAQPGLSVYPKEARLSDVGGANRTESTTYLFQAGGEYRLPGVELNWWNETQGKIETARLAPVSITVSGPLAEQVAAETSERRTDGGVRIALLVMAMIVMAIIGWWLYPKARRVIRTLWLARAERRLGSEAQAFRQLQKATRAGGLAEIDEQLMGWLDRLDGGISLPTFVERAGARDLLKLLAGISSERYGPGSDIGADSQQDLKAADRRSLRELLRDGRRAYRRWQVRQVTRQGLPALNPLSQ